MGTLKQRHNRGRTRRRRSHHALTPIKFIKCGKCGASVLPHIMCATCGTYNKRAVLTILSKAEKAKAKSDKNKKKSE